MAQFTLTWGVHPFMEIFLQDLLHFYNAVLNTGNVPCTWNKTIFIVSAKFTIAKLPSDFQPIANVHILYNIRWTLGCEQ